MGNVRTGHTLGKKSFSQPHIHTVALAWHLHLSNLRVGKNADFQADMISIYLPSSKLAIQPVLSEPILLPCLICLQSRMPASLLPQLDSFQRSPNIANFPAIAFPTYFAFAVLTGLQFPGIFSILPIIIFLPGYPGMASLRYTYILLPHSRLLLSAGMGNVSALYLLSFNYTKSSALLTA